MQFIEAIDPALLKPNPWNTNIVSPSNEDKLEESIDRLGMFKPIIARTLNDGTLEILGGEHRADAARRKNMTISVIDLGTIDDNKAKEISLVDNGRYGTDDTLKLAELLADLGTQDDLSSFLPYSDDEFDAVFSSASIDLDDLDLPDDSDEPAHADTEPTSSVQTHQIMRFKVPIEDAHRVTEIIEKTIKNQGLDTSDSMTNAGDALMYLFEQFKNLPTKRGSE